MWTILVLITKENIEIQGIGLLESLCKVVKEIIGTRLRACVCLHDILHGFHAGRGTEMLMLELKMVQELASLDQDPLVLIFLDLKKAYATVYRGLLLMTLEVYGAGPHMFRLLETFWEHQEVFTHQNRYHGPQFRTTRGKTQGGPISSSLFYFIVNNMVRNWLDLTVEDQLVAQEGLGLLVGRCLGLFYMDDGVTGSRDP